MLRISPAMYRKLRAPAQTLLVALLAVAIFVGLWVYAPALRMRLMPEAAVPGSAELGCNLSRTPCSATFPGGGSLRLALSPRPVPVARSLTAEVTVDGIDARKVEIDFAGVDMEMGFNRVRLSPATANSFHGTGSLPVCTSGRMAWRATVLIDTPRGMMAVPFQFFAPDNP